MNDDIDHEINLSDFVSNEKSNNNNMKEQKLGFEIETRISQPFRVVCDDVFIVVEPQLYRYHAFE